MAFKTTVAAEIVDLGAGEVIKSAPYDVQAYDKFEEGLKAGRFCRIASGELKNIDGTATPALVGIPRRKVTGEIADTADYTKQGLGYDSVAEVIEFGYATVEIATTAAPTKRAPVNIINKADDTTGDNGRATEEAVTTGIIASSGAIFWEPKAPGVWLIRFNKYL